MKMKLRTKATLGIGALIIFLLLICTFAVSVLVNKQNREVSNELLSKSFTLIDELISNRQKKLMVDSRQIASMNLKNIMDIVTTGKSALYSMLKPVYVKTAEGIYNIAVNADVQKAGGHLVLRLHRVLVFQWR